MQPPTPNRLVLVPGADHSFPVNWTPCSTRSPAGLRSTCNDSGQRHSSRLSPRTATEFFTGALEACNIESAFDRRIRFEGNTLKRLLPDGSGPESINLSQYKRIFVIALGKAAGPMLEVLLDRMKRRKGLRGICCTKYLPKKRNWRFRYFEGGHPLAKRGLVRRSSRCPCHAEEGQERYVDLLSHLRRRLGDV